MPTLTANQIYAYAVSAGVPTAQLNNAVATALAESSGITTADNHLGNIGLWQMGYAGSKNDSGTGYTRTQLLDPATNAQAMVKLGTKIGWDWGKKWSTWDNGMAQEELKKIQGDVTYYGNHVPVNSVGQAETSPSTGWDLKVPGVSGVDAIATQIDKAAGWITKPSSWLHVAYAVGGMALVLVGLYVIAQPAINSAAGAVTKVATNTTPVGRATTAVRKATSKAKAKTKTKAKPKPEKKEKEEEGSE